MYKTGNKKSVGNCARCKKFALVNGDGLCGVCAVSMLDQLEKAILLTAEKPQITKDEIAETVGVSPEQVNEWIRLGKIHCVAVRSLCPTCNRVVINQLICPHCGYQSSNKTARSIKPPLRETLTESARYERFSQKKSKKTSTK